MPLPPPQPPLLLRVSDLFICLVPNGKVTSVAGSRHWIFWLSVGAILISQEHLEGISPGFKSASTWTQGWTEGGISGARGQWDVTKHIFGHNAMKLLKWWQFYPEDQRWTSHWDHSVVQKPFLSAIQHHRSMCHICTDPTGDTRLGSHWWRRTASGWYF